MCEIAIAKTTSVDADTLGEVAETLYDVQGDALGIVAVKIDDGDFHYDVFRSTSPNDDEIRDFVNENWEGASRFIVHGRFATSGERDNRGTHPIPIDCPECDIDYVLHNGVIGNIHREKQWLEDEGHEWTTTVDSELLAHMAQEIPRTHREADETIAAAPTLSHQPGYVLMNEDRIYIRATRGYHLTDHGEVFSTHRNIAPTGEENYTAFILRSPNNQAELKEEGIIA